MLDRLTQSHLAILLFLVVVIGSLAMARVSFAERSFDLVLGALLLALKSPTDPPVSHA